MESDIKAIIGLGNPGAKHEHQRHNIGFKVLDALGQKYNGVWHAREFMEISEIFIDGKKVLLIKPQTWMNDSGKVIPYLLKKGLKPENILVVHDELEVPFGKVKVKIGGSARGHNGVRSIISVMGPDFRRIRFGIGRPETKEEVFNYVLSNFKEEPHQEIADAVLVIEELITNKTD